MDIKPPQKDPKHLVGTMVTMKDDIEYSKLAPQDRLLAASLQTPEEPKSSPAINIDFDLETNTSQGVERPADTTYKVPKPESVSQSQNIEVSNSTLDLKSQLSTTTPTESGQTDHPIDLVSQLKNPTPDPNLANNARTESPKPFNSGKNLENSSLSGFAFDTDPFQTEESNNLQESKQSTQPTESHKPSMPSPKLDSLNGGFDPMDFGDTEEGATKKSKPRKSKAPLFLGLAVVLLAIIGAGGYFLAMQLGFFKGEVETPSNIDFSQNQDSQDPSDSNTDSVPSLSNETSVSPVNEVAIVTVPISTNNIRTDILNALNTESKSLTELELVDEQGIQLGFSQFVEIMSLKVPSQLTRGVKDYWPIVYNQEGIYKITLVVELEPALVASQVIVDWLSEMPKDLAGFSLTSSSRSVQEGAIMNSVDLQSPNGKVIKNYFYNYTGPDNSLDVTYFDNYLLFASSQDSMGALRSSIDF